MENVGARVYNMGSVGFVSREIPCLCDFPGHDSMNGVQEVAGSNPVAATFARQVGTTSSDWPFSHLGGSFRPRGRVAGRDLTVPYYPIPLIGSLIRGCSQPANSTAEPDPLRVC